MFGKTHLDMGTGHIYVRPTWFSLFGVLTILFGGFNPSDKYESQLGLLFSIYGKMFQTTNQHLIILSLSLSRSLSLSLTPSLPRSLSLSLSPSIAFRSGMELLVYAILTHTHMQRENLTTTFLCGKANDKPSIWGWLESNPFMVQ